VTEHGGGESQGARWGSSKVRAVGEKSIFWWSTACAMAAGCVELVEVIVLGLALGRG
jgi:hypothetical protein